MSIESLKPGPGRSLSDTWPDRIRHLARHLVPPGRPTPTTGSVAAAPTTAQQEPPQRNEAPGDQGRTAQRAAATACRLQTSASPRKSGPRRRSTRSNYRRKWRPASLGPAIDLAAPYPVTSAQIDCARSIVRRLCPLTSNPPNSDDSPVAASVLQIDDVTPDFTGAAQSKASLMCRAVIATVCEPMKRGFDVRP